MKTSSNLSSNPNGLTAEEIKNILQESLGGVHNKFKKILLVPPDITRLHSGAGLITALLYKLLSDHCIIDILPALGTHDQMTDEERDLFFGHEIPKDRFLTHNWRTDVKTIGHVPADFVTQVSEGLMTDAIEIAINKHLLDPSYDHIISIGQVVPHEVVGMANYSKNILVGCGGKEIIDYSHLLGAIYGMERIMGQDHSPVRKVFDYAEEKFLCELPLTYILTVTTEKQDTTQIHGLFVGKERELFEQAVKLSQEKNITILDQPVEQLVVYLNEREFKSTWLGNKAIYRTRMAIADGGTLLILAPGVVKFGEDAINDQLIQKYGYFGQSKIKSLLETEKSLQENFSVAAHLIHGSSENRFNIIYATQKLKQAQVEKVGFSYMPYDKALQQYDPSSLKDGWNELQDKSLFYYISNPALGLWSISKKIKIT